MKEINLGVVEAHFADIVWFNEPLSSGELVGLCEKELGWKKSTTYTVLKKLCEKGIFKNENSIVTSLVSKEEFYAIKSEKFVEETFKGSLPAFIAAFTKRKSLTAKEIEQIQQMINDFKGEE
ncbi:MAG: BlaI/MecI/CopY family transcriptional regulator [Ruminococcaceae bacterium]|nr:BlaI/MecI/CopY family transcriptional regulator [Oscillospiraceae bacterium]